MKKKVLVSTVILSLLFTYLVSAKTVSAFWLFDLLKGGRVKGEQTTNQQGQIQQYFQNMMRGFSGSGGQGGQNNQYQQTGQYNQGGQNQGGQYQGSQQQISPTGQTEQEDQTPLSESKINQLVTAGRLTSTQGSQLITRMRAIKAKRDELKVLEQELAAWFRNNNIDSRMFGGQQGQGQQQQGGGQGQGTQNQQSGQYNQGGQQQGGQNQQYGQYNQGGQYQGTTPGTNQQNQYQY